jgi:hypothetical protein
MERELISLSLDDGVYFGIEYMNRNEIAVKLNVKYSCLNSETLNCGHLGRPTRR